MADLKYLTYVTLGRGLKSVFNIVSPRKLDPSREVSDMKLMMFCGKSGTKMLKPVLISIYKRWKKIPKVVIVTDGTDVEQIKQSVTFWPYPLTVKTWKDCADYFAKQNKKELVAYAEKNIWGKKLISILAEGEQAPTLYCDTDVLWFDEPSLPHDNSVAIRMASDDLHCYSEPMIRHFKTDDLLKKNPLNAGVIYVNGSMFSRYRDFDKVTQYLSEHYDNRTEQTTFAMLANEIGDTWSLNDILLTTEDTYRPFPTYYGKDKKHFARHHVSTKKWWFWRDAIYVVMSDKNGTVKK